MELYFFILIYFYFLYRVFLSVVHNLAQYLINHKLSPKRKHCC